MIIKTSYGYITRDGTHEMWADDERTLAKAFLGGKSAWTGRDHQGGIVREDEEALMAYVRGQELTLPSHIRTRACVYHRVIREHFELGKAVKP